MAHNLRNTAMQFLKRKKQFFIFYIYLFHGQLISVHADKRCVYKMIHVLFIVRCIESMRTNPSCMLFFADIFPMSLSFFDMILDRGGGCHGYQVCVRSIVGGGVNNCDPKRRTE